MKREITAESETQVKGPKSPKTQENELGDFIEYMVAQMGKRYRNQVLDQLQVSTVDKFADEALDAVDISRLEVFTDAQVGNYAAILLRLAKRVKRKLLTQFDDDRIEAQIRKTLGKVDRKTREQFYSRIAAKVGINVQDLIAKEGLKATTNALILETAQWVTTLRDEALEKFTNNTLFAMSQGESLDTIVSQFEDIVSERKNHARFLARNQVQNYNSITTKIRAQNLGITKAIWVTAGDERVRPSHEARDGKEFDLAEGLYSSTDGQHLLPGTDYNCFPGWSQLNHTSLCNKLYRRWYTGKLHALVFDDGVVLETTANHPVLTDTGFKPAHLINAGDYVVRRLDEGVNTAELYGDCPVPTFDQIYSALDFLGVEHGIAPAISGKFHGDVSDGEVEVVAFDSELMREADASVLKKLGEIGFTVSDQVVVLNLLTCNSNAVSVLVGMGLPAHSIMSALDLARSLLVPHLTPLECFRFALGAWGDALLNEPGADDIARDSKVFGDCIFAFSVLVHGSDLIIRKIESLIGSGGPFDRNPGLIKMTLEDGKANPGLFAYGGNTGAINCKLVRVAETFSADFSGHVYNLETVTNDYITQTTAVSNCRCTYEMIIPAEE